MRENRLWKGIIHILSANILNLIFSLGTTFILPKFLTVEAYSQIKAYQLYVTYTAIFHFGYNDGMILKYGGKTLKSLDKNEICPDLSTARIFQIVMTGICVLCAWMIGDCALIMAACTVLPLNMIGYFRNLYQAIGAFGQYSKILGWTTFLTFAINLILVGVIRTEDFLPYLMGYVFLNLWIWIRLEKNFHQALKTSFVGHVFCFRILKDYIFDGIFLLGANLSSMLLTGIDRFCVKGFMGTFDFAIYAFAASMQNFLHALADPVSISLYPYFCTHDEKDVLRKAQEVIIGFSVTVSMGAFGVQFLLEQFLTEYKAAGVLVFILFAAQMYFTVIQCLYVNLYKARKRQRDYAKKMTAVVVVTIVLNIAGYYIYPKREVFAVGTLLSGIIWLLLCQIDFPDMRCSLKQYMFLGIQTGAFLITGLCLPVIFGMVVYGLLTLIMIKIFIPDIYVWVRKRKENIYKRR